jgi:hypothetical protein
VITAHCYADLKGIVKSAAKQVKINETKSATCRSSGGAALSARAGEAKHKLGGKMKLLDRLRSTLKLRRRSPSTIDTLDFIT